MVREALSSDLFSQKDTLSEELPSEKRVYHCLAIGG